MLDSTVPFVSAAFQADRSFEMQSNSNERRPRLTISIADLLHASAAANDNTAFVYDDGGRAASGYKGPTGDCVVRAIAIASGRPYQEVYDALNEGCRKQKKSKKCKKSVSARDGVLTDRKWFKDYMKSIGFQWTPTMGIGTGCLTHLSASELPQGRLIVSLSKHLCAVIDGVIRDTYDPSRCGTRCVYGYWHLTQISFPPTRRRSAEATPQE